ncbi:hypothetical protein J6590_014801 [Homalodisca vitripennis]|nr:hypothetical protein J6590_014801 [Homalodisca vitripennis]
MSEGIRHLHREAEGAAWFCCNTCGRRYKRKSTLTQHLRNECNQEPKFACHLCPYRGKRNTSLQSHIYNRHRVKKYRFLSSGFV